MYELRLISDCICRPISVRGYILVTLEVLSCGSVSLEGTAHFRSLRTWSQRLKVKMAQLLVVAFG